MRVPDLVALDPGLSPISWTVMGRAAAVRRSDSLAVAVVGEQAGQGSGPGNHPLA